MTLPKVRFWIATILCLSMLCLGCSTALARKGEEQDLRIVLVAPQYLPTPTENICCLSDGSKLKIQSNLEWIIDHTEELLSKRFKSVKVIYRSDPRGTYDVLANISVNGAFIGDPGQAVDKGLTWMAKIRLSFEDTSGVKLGTIEAASTSEAVKYREDVTYTKKEHRGVAFFGITYVGQVRVINDIMTKVEEGLDSSPLSIELLKLAGRKVGPSNLEIEVGFDDSRGELPNRELDRAESAEIFASVRNKGPGTAYGVMLSVVGSLGIDVEKPKALGNIPPGGLRRAGISVKSAYEIKTPEAVFLVEAREVRGYDAPRVNLIVPLAKSELPKLLFSEISFNDSISPGQGDGDGKPSNGETLEAKFFIRNLGAGDAGKVTATFEARTTGVEVIRSSVGLGTIPAGEARQGTLLFRLPPVFASNKIDLRFKAEDGRGDKFARSEVERSWDVTIRRPQVLLDYRIFDGNSPESSGNRDGVLSNGEVAELELTTMNLGQVISKGVHVKMTSPSSGLVFSATQVEIGDLPPGSVGAPRRMTLSVPRTFASERIVLNLETIQRDFPVYARQLVLPVRILNTDLRLSASGFSSLQQGERRRLTVLLENHGSLRAEGVGLEIQANWPGLDVLSASKEMVGTIEPGALAKMIQVDLYARPGAKIGAAAMTITVHQADFAPLVRSIDLPIVDRPPVQAGVEPGPPPVSSISLGVVTRPVIFFRNYTTGQIVTDDRILLNLEVQDAKGLSWIEVEKDGQSKTPEKVLSEPNRELGVVVTRYRVPVSLSPGKNLVQVVAVNQDGVKSEATLSLTRAVDQQEIWAAVIGVSRYEDSGIKALSFADSDAEAFRRYLVNDLGVPESHISMLINEGATRQQIIRTLGDRLRSQAGPDDIVFIYFAGHGANEPDRRSNDGSSKYLLPFDADKSSYNSTALSMEELERQFDRVGAERVIIILDSCFSGAAGGRTIFDSAYSQRGPLSSDFLLQIAESGRGRVVMTASDINEVAQEKGDLRQGVFTHFLLEGLKGNADKPPFGNTDGAISVDEVYAYTSRKVRETTKNLQNPQKFGHVSGELLIGRVPESPHGP